MKQQTPLIYLSKIEHRDEIRIKVSFPYTQFLLDKLKTIEGRKWSKSKNCWHLPYSTKSFNALRNLFGNTLILPTKEKNEKDNSFGRIIPNLQDYTYKGNLHKRFVGKKILIQKIDHKSIAVYIPYDKRAWINVVKNINGRDWNVELTCWEIPFVKSSFRHIKKQIGLNYVIFDLHIKSDIPDEPERKIRFNNKRNKVGKQLLNDKQLLALQQLEEFFILKQYSVSTIKAYKNHLVSLFIFFDKLDPEKLKPENVRAYILHLIKFKKISASSQNQIINAYKAYCENILGEPKLYIEIPRPKKPKKLPNVLSQEDVQKLFAVTKNQKHKLILLLIYSSGLRLGEVVNLRKRDVNIKRNTIHIKAGKGKKDRIVSLAKKAIPTLNNYLHIYKPTSWLFEGQYGGKYSVRSVQSIFSTAVEKSKINAYATVHTLRHSFATHCVENGYSIALVQKALGHNSIKTTEIYLHLSNEEIKKLKSPLDNFDF